MLTLDCADLDLQTAVWCGALGYDYVGGLASNGNPPTRAAPAHDVLQQVDESKSAKCRLHLDLHVADIAAGTERLVALCATYIERVDEFGSSRT